MGPILTSILQWSRTYGNSTPVVCPICGNSLCCPKAGCYKRYCRYRNKQIRVQRYLCRKPECPAVTFSILPPSLFPFVSFGFKVILLITILVPVCSKNSLAKRFDCARSTIRSLFRLGKRIFSWLTETGLLKSAESWSEFCALFSRAIFPRRLRHKGINTTPPMAHGKLFP